MATVAETRSNGSEFPLTRWEVTAAFTVVFGFILGLFCVYFTMPVSDYSFLRLPQSVEDLQILRDNLESYTRDYTAQVLVGYLTVYIFMQTFMIPGTVFMSLLAGALFGVFKGVALVVFAATAGASSCYFLSKLIGRPLVFSLWPDKLSFFQGQVAKRREKLLNYMLFLRVTPTLPNTFINVASPIVDVPYHIFFFGTFIGIIPAAYVTVRGAQQACTHVLGKLMIFRKNQDMLACLVSRPMCPRRSELSSWAQARIIQTVGCFYRFSFARTRVSRIRSCLVLLNIRGPKI